MNSLSPSPYCQLTDQTVLVTGASGFVGERLTRLIQTKSTTVCATYYRHPVTIDCVQTFSVDLAQRQAVEQLIDETRPTMVFHCAAATNVAQCQQHPDEARRDIVEATANLVEGLSNGPHSATLVSLSTDLVFDGQDPPYDESSPTNPLSVYGQLKLEAEAPVLAFPRGTVIRTSLVYGPSTTHKKSFLGWIFDHFRHGKPLPLFMDEIRTPIFVEDLAQAIMMTATRNLTGLWHAGGPQRLDRATMGRLICTAYGYDERLVEPTALADSTYPAPRPQDVSLESGKLWHRLGTWPRTFEQGLAQMASSRDNHP